MPYRVPSRLGFLRPADEPDGPVRSPPQASVTVTTLADFEYRNVPIRSRRLRNGVLGQRPARERYRSVALFRSIIDEQSTRYAEEGGGTARARRALTAPREPAPRPPFALASPAR